MNLTIQRIKRKLFSHVLVTRTIVLMGLLALVLLAAFLFLMPVIRVGAEIISGPINIISIFLPQHTTLLETNGRTNILILGTGGAIHDGPNLTDSMLVVSIYTKKTDNPKNVPPTLVISIPRDIYLDSLKEKVNTAYAIGQAQGKGTGFVLAKGAVSQIIGIPIHYAVQADFTAFEKIIDLVSGVDVNVEHTFDDFQYPIDGKENDLCGGDLTFACRYEHVHFDAGMQHMDGKTALIFVRSRHAEGDEGTDFARAARQQKVIAALKVKLLSSQIILNPQKIEEAYNILKSNVSTDVDPTESGLFIKLLANSKNVKTEDVVIGLDLLDNPPIDERGWILVPKDGTFSQIHEFINSKLESK